MLSMKVNRQPQLRRSHGRLIGEEIARLYSHVLSIGGWFRIAFLSKTETTFGAVRFEHCILP